MEVQFHLGKHNMTTLICPKCGWTKTIDGEKYLHVEKAIRIKVRCRCGHVYVAMLDRRKSHRKNTDLYGTFVKTRLPGTYISEKDGITGEATIVNLSREGVRFQVAGKMRFQPEDQVRMEFHLDDRNRSRIGKRVIVKSIQGSEVGAQFATVDPTDSSDVAIGFYLLSKS